MAVKVKDVLQKLEQLAPATLAEDWDNVGLLVGSPSDEVTGIYICLDLTLKRIEEAVDKACNVILSHHPVIFKPLKHIRYDDHQGKLIATAIKNNLHLIAAHTNFDSASQGVSFQLAQKLGLANISVLMPSKEKLYKLVVFVPQSHEEALRQALGDAGAGHIGNYSHCSFASPGVGSFLPLEGTQPYIGTTGQLEKVAEARLETIVPQSILTNVLKKMLAVHPYEEVAYDLIPLANEQQSVGLGCLGELLAPTSLADFAAELKKRLGIKTLKIAGDPGQTVKKVAVCGGAGKIALNKAIAKGADVLVTGELGHHDAQLALEEGIALIDAGHFATEQVALPYLVSFLQKELNNSVQIILTNTEKDVWNFI